MRRFLICEHGFTDVPEFQDGCWVDVERPDENDYRYLTDTLGIPAEMVNYTADIDERPRIERQGEWILTILRIPSKSDDPEEPIHTIPISIIIGSKVTVTVCARCTRVIDLLLTRSRSRDWNGCGSSTFILQLLYNAAFCFLKYLKTIANEVSLAEAKLQRSVKNSDLLQLMRQQQSLVYFSTSIRGNEVLLSRLHHVFTDDFDRDLLDDVEIELKQAMSTVTVYTEILGGTLDTFASIISNNVNAIMKRMTGTTIVLMIPTLIASFYGMNVEISISSLPGAFWLVVALAGLLTLAAVLLLRHLKWF